MSKVLEKIKNGEVNFFDIQDLDKLNLENETKETLIEIIKELNRQMVGSIDNWDGG